MYACNLLYVLYKARKINKCRCSDATHQEVDSVLQELLILYTKKNIDNTEVRYDYYHWSTIKCVNNYRHK